MTLIHVISLSSIPEDIPQLLAVAEDTALELLSQWQALSSRIPSYLPLSPLHSIESSRTQLCEWAYLLVDHYNIERSVVSIAFSMFDRYILTTLHNNTNGGNNTNEIGGGAKKLELAALSCVYTAIKVHSTSGRLPSCMLAKLARTNSGEAKRFSIQEIECMEYEICSVLGWRVNPPVVGMFLDLALRFVEANISDGGVDVEWMGGVRDLAVFLVEISVIDVYFSNVSPASVAIGSVLVALEEVASSTDAASSRRVIESLHVDARESGECAHRLAQHYANWKQAEENKRRMGSASPTGVCRSTSSLSTEGDKGSSLEDEFEGEVVETSSPTKQGKRKRSSS
jgi:hypothetical protein